jgi:hypothetical protein
MNVAIDVGKESGYIVVEDNGNITTEGYVPTTKDWFFTIENLCAYAGLAPIMHRSGNKE